MITYTLKVDGNYIVIEKAPNVFEFERPARYTVGRIDGDQVAFSYPPIHPYYRKFFISQLVDETATPFTEQTLRDFIINNTGA